jgi:hypothetical protein
MAAPALVPPMTTQPQLPERVVAVLTRLLGPVRPPSAGEMHPYRGKSPQRACLVIGGGPA